MDILESSQNEKFHPEVLRISQQLLGNFRQIQSNSRWGELEIEKQFRAQLGLKNTEIINEDAVSTKIKPIWHQHKNPWNLKRSAVKHLDVILKGRNGFFSPNDIDLMASTWSAGAYYEYLNLSAGKFYKKGITRNLTSVSDNHPESIHSIIDFCISKPFFLDWPPIHQPFMDISAYANKIGYDHYPRTKEHDPLELIENQLKTSQIVKVLDIGRGANFFLDQIKKRFNKNIYAMGVGLENNKVIDKVIDEDYCGPAEVLPDHWTNKVDLIFSNLSFRYFLFPEKALAEAIRVLAPNGIASLNISSHYSISIPEIHKLIDELVEMPDYEFNKEVAHHYESFQDTQSKVKLIHELAAQQNTAVSVDFFDGATIIHKLK